MDKLIDKIVQKKFKKKSFGYSKDDVDLFLDEIIEEIEHLIELDKQKEKDYNEIYQENFQLKMKVLEKENTKKEIQKKIGDFNDSIENKSDYAITLNTSSLPTEKILQEKSEIKHEKKIDNNTLEELTNNSHENDKSVVASKKFYDNEETKKLNI